MHWQQVSRGKPACVLKSGGVSHAERSRHGLMLLRLVLPIRHYQSLTVQALKWPNEEAGGSPRAQLTVSCCTLPAAALRVPQPGKRSFCNQPDWFHVVKGAVFLPTDTKVLGFIHDKGIEIRTAENLLCVNKIKISNHCLGWGNEPFQFLVKINQSEISSGLFKLNNEAHLI